jgi:alpha-aminoadipate/glutamate carrier protein LysW
MSMPTVPCIHCEHPIQLSDDVKVSEIVNCSDCGAQLEVVNDEPIEMIEAPEVEEDWGE